MLLRSGDKTGYQADLDLNNFFLAACNFTPSYKTYKILYFLNFLLVTSVIST